MRIRGVLVLVVIACSVGGCAIHNVKYTPLRANIFSPRETASIVEGSMGRGFEIMQLIQLPDKTEKQKQELFVSAIHEWTLQLGSHDYEVIGPLSGSGNGYASAHTLQQAMTKKAALKGGDVVLVTDSGRSLSPFSFTTPAYTSGQATTNIYGDTAYTSYQGTTTPSKTVEIYLPHASAIVLRYTPGIEELRQRVLRLDNASVERVMVHISQTDNPDITYEEALGGLVDLLAELEDGTQ